MAKELKHHELSWLADNKNIQLFAVTATFIGLKPIGLGGGMKDRTCYEYRKRVLPKIQKCLCRHRDHWEAVIPITDLYTYEYDQGSLFKKLNSRNPVHHIHGIVPVQRDRMHKIYDPETGTFSERLIKDIKSLNTVRSFDIRLIESGNEIAWLNYMQKGKRWNSE